MFTHEELLTIKEAMKIADAEYMKQVEGATGNKNRVVANKKQKKLWLVQNKLNKIIEETKQEKK